MKKAPKRKWWTRNRCKLYNRTHPDDVEFIASGAEFVARVAILNGKLIDLSSVESVKASRRQKRTK